MRRLRGMGVGCLSAFVMSFGATKWEKLFVLFLAGRPNLRHMVWIIALVCLGLVGIIGYYQGPILGAFTFFGLVFGSVMAGLLATLTKHLLPLMGLVHPIWGIFMPQAIAFVVVFIIFLVGGQVLHQKTAFYFKYKAKDKERISWERMYSRLGFCVGLLNGSVCFLLLMVPIYAAGYFATEAQVDESDLPMPRFLSSTRAEILKTGLARVVGAYDPTPPQLYKAADVAALILHNPLLESRLCHYPPLLQLGEVPEFDAVRNDLPLQNLIQTQAKVRDLITYPRLQAVLTNAALVTQVSTLISGDLDDLHGFLMTGQSPKYDPETILRNLDCRSRGHEVGDSPAPNRPDSGAIAGKGAGRCPNSSRAFAHGDAERANHHEKIDAEHSQ